MTGNDAKFSVTTDASGTTIDFTLQQDQDKGLQPIAYEARRLSRHEQNYSIHEKELLAVVEAFKKFRTYLEGCKRATVYTDHKSLTSLMTQKDLSGRKARWVEKLTPFASYMEVRYKPGLENCSDGLSRRPDLLNQVSALIPDLTKEISSSYCKDPMYAAEARLRAHIYKHDNLFWTEDKICVPDVKELKSKILKEAHSAACAGHPGVKSTHERLLRNFWWPAMKKEVKSFVSNCPRCQLAKKDHSSTPGLLQPLPTPTLPWEIIGTDLLTDLPVSDKCDAVLVFVCLLTKAAVFIPTRKTLTAEEAAYLFFSNVFKRFGLPRIIVSDRDVRFTSAFWTQLFQFLQTKLNMSTAHHPQTDGQTERCIQQLLSLIRTTTHRLRDDWCQKLPLIEFAYNSALSSSSGTSPFYTLHGFHPKDPLLLGVVSATGSEAADRVLDLQRLYKKVQFLVEQAHRRQKQQTDVKRKDHAINIGDLVKLKSDNIQVADLRCHKLKDSFVGTF